MQLQDFDYLLPPELIAQRPPERRDGGRLMVLDRQTGAVAHHLIDDLPQLLPPNCLLVVNDSRVIPARLWARRKTGGKVEILLLEKSAKSAVQCRKEGHGIDEGCQNEQKDRNETEHWLCLVRSSKPLHLGEKLEVERRPGADVEPPSLSLLSAPVNGRCVLEIASPAALVAHGTMPLPPYIRRPADAADRERYQTVYAQDEGSIAAPTAGLHFTPDLLQRLQQTGIARCAITLHVGPGTFVPVRVENILEHEMDAERFRVSETAALAINNAKAEGRKIVAVGTTAVRTLEASGGQASQGRTDLFITPGFHFQVVDALLSNFHLPRSTLLMLVAAFAGREHILDAYRQAVTARYRFYSFGDAMLII